LAGSTPSLHFEDLHAGQVVADLVYYPRETPLLAAAREAGATAVGGLGCWCTKRRSSSPSGRTRSRPSRSCGGRPRRRRGVGIRRRPVGPPARDPRGPAARRPLEQGTLENVALGRDGAQGDADRATACVCGDEAEDLGRLGAGGGEDGTLGDVARALADHILHPVELIGVRRARRQVDHRLAQPRERFPSFRMSPFGRRKRSRLLPVAV